MDNDLQYYLRAIKNRLNIRYNTIRSFGKTKVFGIGMNKTGTTSLNRAMKDLGYIVGNQISAIKYVRDYARRDLKSIVRYCHTAQFFQDIPFSMPFTFIVLDQAFPGSKFILTVRDDSEQWYNSLTHFHTKLWGENGQTPTKNDLLLYDNPENGNRWEKNRIFFNTPEEDIYNKKILIDLYESHNQYVKDYFRFREEDLLVVNLAKEGSYLQLCEFLGKKPKYEEFPWENKTTN